MSEFERLQDYSPDFSLATLDTVAESAEQLRSLTSWPEIQENLIQKQALFTSFTPTSGRSIDILNLIPDDYENTALYHLPMGNGLDANMQTRLAALSNVLPDTRVIAVGNPSIPASSSGVLTYAERKQVAAGDFRPTIGAALEYINQLGIDSLIQIGGSYGADKAIASARYSENYDIATTDAIIVDPASVVQRSALGLLRAFQSTEEHLKGYVSATNWEGYNDARNQTGNMAQYALGLMRASNIAIGMGIAKGRLREQAISTMRAIPDLRIHTAWGTASELADNQAMKDTAQHLHYEFGPKRSSYQALDDQHHAMMDDLFLNNAIILEGINRKQ